MEITEKEIVKSTYYFKDIKGIFKYGESTFGENAAIAFFEQILSDVEKLKSQYLLHPECRHLETKTKKY